MKFKEYKEIIHRIMEVQESEREKITQPEKVRLVCLEFCTKEQESFIVITLNGASKVIQKHEVTKGLLNRTLVHPREIFRKAIIDNAASIIIVHNHPSGELFPSKEDDKVTTEIKKAGELLGISLLDHVIIGPTENYYSYREEYRL